MSAAPDFRLYHGNDLGVLAALLASELAKPMPGDTAGLAPDTLLIPQPAMKRWLQHTLAQTHGVAANLRFLTPGEFVTEALAANLEGDDTALADARSLRWRLWLLLADAALVDEPTFAPLRAALAGPSRALAAWSLAGELAQAFEKYQAWRRGWLLRWDGGADPHDWQAELWRRATRGLVHRARRLHAYLQRCDGDAPQAPRGLPPRLFAFACQNVSPDVLRVIASVARSGELHFFFASPVRGWWGDLPGARERLRADAAGVFAADREHPLLIANGGAGRDFVDLLFAGEAVHPRGEVPAYVPALPPPAGKPVTLLRELQQDLLERNPPPAAARAAFDPGDRSLQLHACHTALREVQVLHEQLRSLLEADPTLQARDIAVLTPDIDAYAPLVHAVFGAALATPRAIPYALADASALAAQPLAAWWLQLLALPAARFTLAEGLALLAPAAVRERLGLSAAAHARLGELLREAGARWGRDGAHRVANGAPAAEEFTWRWAFDRLLLGHAAGDELPQAGLAPLPTLEGGDLGGLDALLAGLDTLDRLARELARPHAPADWLRLLAGALADLLPERAAQEEDRVAIAELRALFGVLAAEWKAAASLPAVDADVLRSWFASRLGEADARQPFLGHGVTFGRMVPLRLIPFRVICLLGMNDGDYPRRDPGGALNRLAAELRSAQRQPGDRSVREDDRFLFLQLFAAAGDAFYASWVGADPRGGELRAPSVVVAELIEVAARYRRNPEADPQRSSPSVAERLVLRHPLHPFAPQAFGAPWPGEPAADAMRRRPWQADWRAAVDGADATRTRLPRFATPLPPRDGAGAPPRTLAALRRALENPARHFLQQRLDVRLPREEDAWPDSEPFAHDDGRQRFQLAQRVYAELRDGQGDDLEQLRRRLLAEGLLPPGAAGAVRLDAALALAAPGAHAARAWSPDPVRQQPFQFELDGSGFGGRFEAVHARGLVQFRPGAAHGRVQLGFGLEHLAWHAAGETRPVLRLIAGEPPLELPRLEPDAARLGLRTLRALAAQAGLEALPFLPRAGYAWYAARATGTAALDAARRCWCGGDGQAGEGEDAWVRLALRGQDPFADGDAEAIERFQHLSLAVFEALQVPAGEHAVD